MIGLLNVKYGEGYMVPTLPAFFLPLQGTVKKAGGRLGIGVHTGQKIFLKIVFVRKDLGDAQIRASWKNVVDTRFSTTLGNAEGVTITTVEHLLAACWALGIDNARIEVNGPEVPILDGSAAPWLTLLNSLGVMCHKTVAPVIQILKTIRIQENSSWIEISPAQTFSLDITASLGEGNEHTFFYTLGDRFADQIASARTLALFEHVQKMRMMGLIRGGSLENAVVIDRGEVLNPEGLRFQNECARHKALDLIGDWSLGGRLNLGAVQAYTPGHAFNYKLLRLILEDKTAWEPVSYKPGTVASTKDLKKTHVR